MTFYLLATYDCRQWSLTALRENGEVDSIAEGGVYTISSYWSQEEGFIDLLTKNGVRLHKGDVLIYCVDSDIQDAYTIKGD